MTIDSNNHGKPGHNSGTQWQQDRDEDYGVAIESFVGEARLQEAWLRNSLDQLEGLQRLLVIRNTLMMGLARQMRMNPRMSCDTALYVLICLLSDNPNGYCWLSQRRFSEILARNRTTVVGAIGRLVQTGMIGMSAGNGENNAYWPSAHPMVAQAPSNLTWFVDRFSTSSQQVRAKTAAPIKPLAARIEEKRNPSVVREESGQPVGASKREPVGSTRRVLQAEPVGSNGGNLSAPPDTIDTNIILSKPSKNIKKREEEAPQPLVVEVKSPGHPNIWRAREDQYVLYHGQYNAFGGPASPLDIGRKTVERQKTDADLDAILYPHRHQDPVLLENTLDDVLGDMQSKITGDAASGKRGGGGLGAYTRYVRQKFADQLDKARIRKLKADTEAAIITETAKIKVGKETKAADMQLQALGSSIERKAVASIAASLKPGNATSGHSRGSTSEYQTDAEGLLRFYDGGSFANVGFTKVTGADANDVLDEVRSMLETHDKPGEDWLVKLIRKTYHEVSMDPLDRAGIFSSGTLGKGENAPIGKIVKTWAKFTYRKAILKVFGKPEAQITCTKPSFKSEWVHMPQAVVGTLMSECPDVTTEDMAAIFDDMTKTVHVTAMHEQDPANVDGVWSVLLRLYGRGLQAQAEARFTAKVRARQTANVWRRDEDARIAKEREEAAARMAAQRAERKAKDDAEAEARRKRWIDEINSPEYQAQKAEMAGLAKTAEERAANRARLLAEGKLVGGPTAALQNSRLVKSEQPKG